MNRGFNPYDRVPDAEPKIDARFVGSSAGSMRLMRQRVTWDAPSGLQGDAGTLGFIFLRDNRSVAGLISRLDLEPTRERLGFGWGDYSMFSPNPTGGGFKFEYSVVAIPYWPLLVMTAIAPAIWLRRRWVLHHRWKLGLCLACGYDLRASPGQCPECGMLAKVIA